MASYTPYQPPQQPVYWKPPPAGPQSPQGGQPSPQDKPSSPHQLVSPVGPPQPQHAYPLHSHAHEPPLSPYSPQPHHAHFLPSQQGAQNPMSPYGAGPGPASFVAELDSQAISPPAASGPTPKLDPVGFVAELPAVPAARTDEDEGLRPAPLNLGGKGKKTTAPTATSAQANPWGFFLEDSGKEVVAQADGSEKQGVGVGEGGASGSMGVAAPAEAEAGRIVLGSKPQGDQEGIVRPLNLKPQGGAGKQYVAYNNAAAAQGQQAGAEHRPPAMNLQSPPLGMRPFSPAASPKPLALSPKGPSYQAYIPPGPAGQGQAPGAQGATTPSSGHGPASGALEQRPSPDHGHAVTPPQSLPYPHHQNSPPPQRPDLPVVGIPGQRPSPPQQHQYAHYQHSPTPQHPQRPVAGVPAQQPTPVHGHPTQPQQQLPQQQPQQQPQQPPYPHTSPPLHVQHAAGAPGKQSSPPQQHPNTNHHHVHQSQHPERPVAEGPEKRPSPAQQGHPTSPPQQYPYTHHQHAPPPQQPQHQHAQAPALQQHNQGQHAAPHLPNSQAAHNGGALPVETKSSPQALPQSNSPSQSPATQPLPTPMSSSSTPTAQTFNIPPPPPNPPPTSSTPQSPARPVNQLPTSPPPPYSHVNLPPRPQSAGAQSAVPTHPAPPLSHPLPAKYGSPQPGYLGVPPPLPPRPSSASGQPYNPQTGHAYPPPPSHPNAPTPHASSYGTPFVATTTPGGRAGAFLGGVTGKMAQKFVDRTTNIFNETVVPMVGGRYGFSSTRAGDPSAPRSPTTNWTPTPSHPQPQSR